MFDNDITGSCGEPSRGQVANTTGSALTQEETRARIVTAVVGGKLEHTKHFRLRAGQRRVRENSVTDALHFGLLSGEAEWDAIHENWKYRISYEKQGARLIVVFVIDEKRSSLRLITVWKNTLKVKRGAKTKHPIIIVWYSITHGFLVIFVALPSSSFSDSPH